MIWQGENGALPDTNEGERMHENGKEDVHKADGGYAQDGKRIYTSPQQNTKSRK